MEIHRGRTRTRRLVTRRVTSIAGLVVAVTSFVVGIGFADQGGAAGALPRTVLQVVDGPGLTLPLAAPGTPGKTSVPTSSAPASTSSTPTSSAPTSSVPASTSPAPTSTTPAPTTGKAPAAAKPAALVRGTPCTATARACVDLDRRVAWLLDGNRIVRGPVQIQHGDLADPTPRGTFSVQWKAEDWTSTEYDTPMPYSVFFAPGGIAFHEGPMDTYSAGCVKLHIDDARAWFNYLQVGDEVQIR